MRSIKKPLSVLIASLMFIGLFSDISSAFAAIHTQTPGTYESLTGIERIKTASIETNPFSILEIVPTADSGNGYGTGSFGYYLPGQEPIFANFETDLRTLTGTTAREAYFETRTDLLRDRDIISDPAGADNDTVLSDRDYDEIVETFWNTKLITDDYTEITLTTSEERDYIGNFYQVGTGPDTTENGYFNARGTYALAATPNGGTHALADADFISDASYNGTHQFYAVTFATLDSQAGSPPYDTIDPVDGSGDPITLSEYLSRLDVNDRIDTFPETQLYIEDAALTGGYRYIGNTKDDILLAGFNTAFYVVDTITHTPSTTQSAATPFAAVEPTYEPATLGSAEADYVEDTEYILTPYGSGDYYFVESASGAETVTYSYNTVHVRVPYVNNNWFNYDVLNDFDAAEGPFVQVTTRTPSAITADDWASAELIVLSAGFDVTDGSGFEADYTAVNDLTAEQIATLNGLIDDPATAEDIQLPIIVDDRLRTVDATNIANLVDGIYNATPNVNGFVEENVYYFIPGAPNASSTNLITKSFNVNYTPTTLYTDAAGPYYDIYEEIDSENFLRNNAGTPLLPEVINMATSIRYIINFSDQREILNKAEVNVLQLQPLSLSLYNGNVNDPDVITPTSVKNDYLPTDTILTAADITVNTMGTPEFIGKIEDINETYDMLYIGSDIGSETNNVHDIYSNGFKRIGNGTASTTNFKDDTMDGLIYTNIGDGVNFGFWYTGYLDSDYNSTNNNHRGDTTYAARYSGNDITQKKADEIIDFANSGFPIVISDELVDNTNVNAHTPVALPIAIEAANLGNDQYEFKLTDAVLNNIFTNELADFSYQWYRSDTQNGTATSVDYATGFNLITNLDGYYYCEVTVKYKDYEDTARSNTIRLEAFNTINNTTSGASFSDGHGNSSAYHPVTVTTNNSNKTATVFLNFDTTGATIRYEWFEYTGSNNWSGGKGSTIYSPGLDRNDEYYCRVSVTANGSTRHYYSVIVRRESFWDGGDMYTAYSYGGINTSSTTFTVNSINYISSISGNTATMQAVPNISLSDNNYNVTPQLVYTWYSKAPGTANFPTNGTVIHNDNRYTYPAANNLDFGVRISINGEFPALPRYYAPGYFQLRSGRATTNITSYGESLVYPEFEFQSFTIREDRVDNSSIMFDALTDIMDLPNVMSETDASADRDSVLRFLNLSKPMLNVTSSPTEYTDESQLATDLVPGAGNILEYNFSIENQTDPTPSSTRYQLNLYVDLNGDGRYVATEKISELSITDSSGQTIAENELVADTEYSMSRALPENYFGAVPWKLEVVKVGNEAATASVTGLTFNKNDRDDDGDGIVDMTTIKLLQIIGSNTGKATDLLDIRTTISVPVTPSTPTGQLTVNIFEHSFENLRNNGIYDIDVDTYTISEINALASNAGYTTAGAYYDFFNNYNMLMLGFTETFGTDDAGGLISNAAIAITQYIDSGRATLFTHDTASPYAVDRGQSGWPSSKSVFGYTTNVIMRDELGLDRYGVTSAEYGLTKYSSLYSQLKSSAQTPYGTTGNYVANGYDLADSRTINALLESGFSIAYVPGSNRTELLPQTAGNSDLTITRGIKDASSLIDYPTQQYNERNPDRDYFWESWDEDYYADYPVDDDLAVTNQVTQVNEGQITSFPYNVNTSEFGGSGNTLTIAQTHQQWYQLNMNSEDIVVWYALSDSNNENFLDNHYNDVTNTYYIYNSGNVTYSGAGHTSNSGTQVTEAEANLFVNTIVAAYRAATIGAEIDFTDGVTAVSSVYLPTLIEGDRSGTVLDLEEGLANNSGHSVPFVITDSNLTKNELLLALYYEDATGIYYYNTTTGQMQTTGTGTRYSRISGIVGNNLYVEDSAGNRIQSDLVSGARYNLFLPDVILDELGAMNNDNSLEIRLEVTLVVPDDDDLVSLTTPLTVSKLGLMELK